MNRQTKKNLIERVENAIKRLPEELTPEERELLESQSKRLWEMIDQELAKDVDDDDLDPKESARIDAEMKARHSKMTPEEIEAEHQQFLAERSELEAMWEQKWREHFRQVAEEWEELKAKGGLGNEPTD